MGHRKGILGLTYSRNQCCFHDFLHILFLPATVSQPRTLSIPQWRDCAALNNKRFRVVIVLSIPCGAIAAQLFENCPQMPDASG
jgi:hypothetical protein